MWKWLKSFKQTPPVKPEHQNKPVEAEAENRIQLPEKKVIIITGTSGAGRKSIAKQLSYELGIPYILSYTTRAFRSNERNREHYRFITRGEFQTMEERGEFFESVRLERGSYGISQLELFQALEEHKIAIVVVNREGAQTFREHFGNGAIRIFIYVTKDDIRLRQEREGTPSEIIEEYLQNYPEQVVHKKESDYLLQSIDTSSTVMKIITFLRDKNITAR